MFNRISNHFGSVLVSLLAMQGLCSALAVEKKEPLEQSSETELAVRMPDNYQILYHLDPVGASAVIGAASTVGLLIAAVLNLWLSYEHNKPDANKICGQSGVKSITEGGVDYKYYAYSYTTGSKCDSTQRAKTVTDALSKAIDEINSDKYNAVCVDFDHSGTWHGVLGLATTESNEDPKAACSDHHAGAKRSDAGFPELQRSDAGFPELEGSNVAKRDEMEVEKRASITITESNKQSTSKTTKFSDANQVPAVISGMAAKILAQSNAGSCAGVEDSIKDFQGVSYTYHYYASGRNCDTTAQIKTIMTALDDKWDDLSGKTSALCMTLSHGGTWQGHLGVSADESTYPAHKLC
ncbi:MAG: hypothetical protein M1818_004801 [Claussenomyces sp. TS43310]|nr:MAG: hypothetical protein M1818_004801 [Claussenomyces sp. TS43310]